MRLIDESTAELTEAEGVVEEWFNDLLDRGFGIDEAIRQLRHGENAHPRTAAVLNDDKFYRWLAD